MGSRVGGDFSCQWRCKKSPSDGEEEAEFTWHPINRGRQEQGGHGWGLVKRESHGTQRRLLWLYFGAPQSSSTVNRDVCVFASLTDQVREKKDVPLGPEDPKEEDGSFDYRCVISLTPVHTEHPLSGGFSSPPLRQPPSLRAAQLG